MGETVLDEAQANPMRLDLDAIEARWQFIAQLDARWLTNDTGLGHIHAGMIARTYLRDVAELLHLVRAAGPGA